MLGIGRYMNVLLQYFGLNGTIMSFTAAWCVALESTKLDIRTHGGGCFVQTSDRTAVCTS